MRSVHLSPQIKGRRPITPLGDPLYAAELIGRSAPVASPTGFGWSAPAAKAAGSTPSDANAEQQDDGTSGLRPALAGNVAPPASPGTDAQQDDGIRQDGKEAGRDGDGAGVFETDGDPSSLSSDSASRATLSTEQSFSISASASAQTPKSAFTFADSSSNVTTSPNDLPNAVPMNNDSEDEIYITH